MRTLKLSFGLVLIGIMMLGFTSCYEKKENNKVLPVDTAKTGSLEQALKETNRELELAMYKGDYETILKYYTEDIVIVPNLQPLIIGKNEIRSVYLKQKKEGVKIHSFNATTDKIWEAGENIYEYGKFGLSVSSNQTKHPYAFTGSYFMIWEKSKDNIYLIKYLISNYDFNPCNGYY